MKKPKEPKNLVTCGHVKDAWTKSIATKSDKWLRQTLDSGEPIVIVQLPMYNTNDDNVVKELESSAIACCWTLLTHWKNCKKTCSKQANPSIIIKLCNYSTCYRIRWSVDRWAEKKGAYKPEMIAKYLTGSNVIAKNHRR